MDTSPYGADGATGRRRPLAERGRRLVPRAVRRATRGFSLVLVLLLAIYAIAEVFDESDAARAFVWVLAFLSFVVTLRAIDASPRTVYVNLALMGVALAMSLIGLATDQGLLIAPAGAAVSLYSFVAPVLILRYALRRDRITRDVVFGAVAVYVFLGINFAIVYDIVARLDADAFATSAATVPSLFYFSFMTLTTVGYGDITPVSDLARALSVLEALVGEIILVVTVSGLVGLLISQRNAAGPGEGAGDDPTDAGGENG
jgi:hypothetical protein